MAGLHTGPEVMERECQLRAALNTWVRPEEGVFFYAVPVGYLYGYPMHTNLLWLSTFGAANARTVQWWEETGRWPDVVVIPARIVRGAGGWEALAAQDPIIARVVERYRSIDATEVLPDESEDRELMLRRRTDPFVSPAREIPPSEGCAPAEDISAGQAPAAGGAGR